MIHQKTLRVIARLKTGKNLRMNIQMTERERRRLHKWMENNPFPSEAAAIRHVGRLSRSRGLKTFVGRATQTWFRFKP